MQFAPHKPGSALLLYDVRNPRAAKGFSDNRMSLEDWEININQTVAVLAPLANASKYLEGREKSYPTSNLILPSIYGCIHLLKSTTPVRRPWNGEIIPPSALRTEVSEAREQLYDDMVARCVTDLPLATKRFYYIVTICDRRQKGLRVPGVSADDRETAHDWFEAEYISFFAGDEDVSSAASRAAAPAAARRLTSSLPAHSQHAGSSFIDFMANLVSVSGDAATTADGEMQEGPWRMRPVATLTSLTRPWPQTSWTGGQGTRRPSPTCR